VEKSVLKSKIRGVGKRIKRRGVVVLALYHKLRVPHRRGEKR